MDYESEFEKVLLAERAWDDDAARNEFEEIRESIRHYVNASYAALTEISDSAKVEARDAVYRERRHDIERALELIKAHGKVAA